MTMDIDQQCALKLRKLRKIKGLTLNQIEKASAGEFKSVVLGAYERGTRAISLARLERISAFYDVPMSYFFDAGNEKSQKSRWIFDLRQIRKVLEIKDQNPRILSMISLVRAIAAERNDWAGEFLTIRDSDRAIATHILAFGTEELEKELSERKLLLNA